MPREIARVPLFHFDADIDEAGREELTRLHAPGPPWRDAGTLEMHPYLIEVDEQRRREVAAMSEAVVATARELGLELDQRRVPDPARVRFYRPLPAGLEVHPSRAPQLAFFAQPGVRGGTAGLGFNAYLEEDEAVPLLERRSRSGHEIVHMASASAVGVERASKDVTHFAAATGVSCMLGSHGPRRFDLLNEGLVEAANLYVMLHEWQWEADLMDAVRDGRSSGFPLHYVPGVAVLSGLLQHTAERHDVPQSAVFHGALRDLFTGSTTTMAELLMPFVHGTSEQRAAVRDLAEAPASMAMDLGDPRVADIAARLGLEGTAAAIEGRHADVGLFDFVHDDLGEGATARRSMLAVFSKRPQRRMVDIARDIEAQVPELGEAALDARAGVPVDRADDVAADGRDDQPVALSGEGLPEASSSEGLPVGPPGEGLPEAPQGDGLPVDPAPDGLEADATDPTMPTGRGAPAWPSSGRPVGKARRRAIGLPDGERPSSDPLPPTADPSSRPAGPDATGANPGSRTTTRTATSSGQAGSRRRPGLPGSTL